MRRPGLSRVAIAAASTALLAGCGSSSTSSSSTAPGAAPPTKSAGTTTPPRTTPSPPSTGDALRVSPKVATPTSVVTFTFTPPVSSGRQGQTDLSYAMNITGPPSHGCVGIHEASPASAVQGQPSTIEVGPTQLGGRWCVGDYQARMVELARAHCSPGEMCPQYIRVVRVVGVASFTVKRG